MLAGVSGILKALWRDTLSPSASFNILMKSDTQSNFGIIPLFDFFKISLTSMASKTPFPQHPPLLGTCLSSSLPSASCCTQHSVLLTPVSPGTNAHQLCCQQLLLRGEEPSWAGHTADHLPFSTHHKSREFRQVALPHFALHYMNCLMDKELIIKTQNISSCFQYRLAA